MSLYVIILALISAYQGDSLSVFPRTDSLGIRTKDSLPEVIPNVLPEELFIPEDRLLGYEQWHYAPITRPEFYFTTVYGFNGSIGFGQYAIQHPEKFFSTFEGKNSINVPKLYVSNQMMLGNTFRLGKGIYYLSGILYGAQLGDRGNNWGMGTREGFIWHPSPLVTVELWSQYFQSVEVYSPVLFPDNNGSGAALVMPATPEVFSFGLQASFIVGDFIIGVGTSVAPVPFQKRHHSQFYFK